MTDKTIRLLVNLYKLYHKTWLWSIKRYKSNINDIKKTVVFLYYLHNKNLYGRYVFMKNAKKIIAFLMALTLLVSTIQMPVMAATTKKATIKTVSIVKPETKTLVLKAKKSYQLKTKVTVNGKISKKVTYKSSNEKVATVSKNGKIKAV